MPRIRSIKPEFFTDEEIARLPPLYRLAFEGMWCHADKAGRLEDRPARLKVLILPYDEIDFGEVLDALESAGFIERYTADGRPYVQIRTFDKHQRPRPDEPESVIPPSVTDADARRLLGSNVSDTAESVGKERKGKERKERENALAALPIADGAVKERHSPDDFADAWNRATEPPIPRCRALTSKRRRHIQTRLTDRPLTEWIEIMRRIQRSAFCRGENDRGWVATLDWLIGSPDVGVKVTEGKYDDRDGKAPEFSAGEMKQAADWRRAIGRCPHDPACGSFNECLGVQIRRWRRERAGAA